MQAHNYWKDSNWNATDNIYEFETGSKIEFFSTDNGDKLRGARRDRLFMNECNNIHHEAFEQLEVRTKEFVFLDWNPSHEFWFYTEVAHRDDVEHITLTYKDNEALPEEIIQAIEARKGNERWWKVYGLGQLGEVEGKIYTGWKIIDEIPHFAKLERRGLDFGYSTDPTAIVDIYKYNGGFIFHERVYQKGLSNKQIADLLLNMEDPTTIVVADSAEPKSIAEIRSYGVNITACPKGKGSVQQGIQYIQGQRVMVTKNSTNLIKEYRNYLWDTDKNGEPYSPNKPAPLFDHTMDAIRYALTSYQPIKKRTPYTPNFKTYQNKLRGRI